MRTLDRWSDRLTQLPQVIECRDMHVLGRDDELPLFTGPGHLHIRTRADIEFVMHATPREASEAFKRLVRAQNNPYRLWDQFRLIATEYDGTEWNCGWISIRLGDAAPGRWRLSGRLHSLMAGVSGDAVSSDTSVELVYDAKLRLPIAGNMITSVVCDGQELLWSSRPGRKVVEVADTSIEFSHAPEGDLIWATARTSRQFCHPYAENWISEPLRLLLGQLVFPRLVARNKGDGTAQIWLRPSPDYTVDTLTSSILGADPHASPARFWGLYRDILTMVVSARDEAGRPNVEAHPLTQFYHEIAQATLGSHWVLCMTLASTVEGMAKMLAEPDERRSDFDPTIVESLRSHIKEWKEDESLRSRILNSVAHAGEKGIAQFLNGLGKKGIVDREHVSTWLSVRNHVMHGNLISPWLDEDLETRLQNLTELVHGLGAACIRKCVSQISGYKPYEEGAPES